ncbi:MAG: MFS transporter [Halieaceae bacterium]|nr:MFS transporter [Halieaceae bacterium]
MNEFRSGWRLLLAGLLGNALGVGAILFYSMSSFMVPLEQEFGWTRTEMGGAISCLMFGWILVMPLLGRICDRYGPRKPILISIPLLALFMAGLSRLQGELMLLYGLFTASAVFGSGTLGVTYIAAVSKRFDRHRGLAYGITLAGTGISAFVLPIVLNELIGDYGWRVAWLVLAGVVLCQFPIVWLWIRDKDAATAGTMPAATPDSVAGLSLGEVLRVRAFWLLSSAFLLVALVMAGLLINLIPLLREIGLSPQAAASTSAGVGIGLLFARVAVGFLLDRFQARYVAVAAFGVAALGCLLLAGQRTEFATFAVFALGFTSGAELDLLAYMSARYFGLRAHATVYSIGLSIFYFGAVLAPLLVGGLYDYVGDYTLALELTILCCIAASVLILLMGPYPRFEPPTGH